MVWPFCFSIGDSSSEIKVITLFFIHQWKWGKISWSVFPYQVLQCSTLQISPCSKIKTYTKNFSRTNTLAYFDTPLMGGKEKNCVMVLTPGLVGAGICSVVIVILVLSEKVFFLLEINYLVNSFVATRNQQLVLLSKIVLFF